MKTKNKLAYHCTSCQVEYVRWQGQCSRCLEWNTLILNAKDSASSQIEKIPIDTLASVIIAEDFRYSTGMIELDRVLGGGLVTGSVVLIGGDPGIGKSTLLLQSISMLHSQGVPCLYASAEESVSQLAMRSTRLQGCLRDFSVISDTSVERMVAAALQVSARVLVIDSIQTVQKSDIDSYPGSLSQVRECANYLVQFSKKYNVAVIMVGHVNKEGDIAGPRVLEHVVDTVLYFEGESHGSYRLLRTLKNRFGPVNEIGVFAMTDLGLKVVKNPSLLFVSQRKEAVPGSCIMVTQEASRPILLEIQALVDRAHGPVPRRLTVGLDGHRLSLLLAVLHKHGGIFCIDHDVFVNAVAGVRVSETASDLAVIMAIVSSLKNKALPSNWVVFGEVGLTGEIRPAVRGLDRLREAEKLGYQTAIVPEGNLIGNYTSSLKIYPVKKITDALEILFQ